MLQSGLQHLWSYYIRVWSDDMKKKKGVFLQLVFANKPKKLKNQTQYQCNWFMKEMVPKRVYSEKKA
jgi:hypothetical protein